MTNHKDLLHTMAADNLAPCSASASVATEKYAQYMTITQLVFQIIS